MLGLATATGGRCGARTAAAASLSAAAAMHRPWGHATAASMQRPMTTAARAVCPLYRTPLRQTPVSSFLPRHAASRAWHSLARARSPALALPRATAPAPSSRQLRQLSDRSAKPQTPPSAPSAPPSVPPSAPSAPPSTPSTPPAYTPRENIYTVPNFLTAARIAATPLIGYCIVHDQHGMALGLLVTAGLTDLLDGWIARRWKLHTVVGSIIDPMADKILMTVLTVSLAAQGSLPLWLAVLVLGRDVGLALSAIYYRWISLPPPKTFARYWDFSLPSAEVRPTTISKYNTFLQLALMAATTAAPVLETATVPGIPTGLDLQPYLTTLQYVVGVTTVWSGASYIYSKDAVKILTKKV